MVIPYVQLALFWLAALASGRLAASELAEIDTYFVKLGSSKMIQTSDENYAICSDNFASNWRTVSVNGDEFTSVTRDNVLQKKNLSSLTLEENKSLSSIKAELMNVIEVGPTKMRTNETCWLTAFDQKGGVVVTSRDCSLSSNTISFGNSSITRFGSSYFVVGGNNSESNWHRVFLIDDVPTTVWSDRRVIMLPLNSMPPEERDMLVELRAKAEKSIEATKSTAQAVPRSRTRPKNKFKRALRKLFVHN